MKAISNLTIPERLRLRKAFARWQKSPTAFAREIRQAERAIELADSKDYHLSVDRFGVPSASKPEAMTLTQPELRRFKARLATMTDPAEIASTKAAISACEHRGFTAKVDASGRLLAIPPHQVERVPVDLAREKRRHQTFNRKLSGASAFKPVPATIP